MPQAAGRNTFSAFVLFTVLGPLAPGGGAFAFASTFTSVPPSAGGAPAGNSGALAAAPSSGGSAHSGALGATKTLHLAVLSPSGGNWWFYAALGASLLTFALLAWLLFAWRRGRTA